MRTSHKLTSMLLTLVALFAFAATAFAQVDAVGPGTVVAAPTVSDQIQGSVLIYNIYTSNAANPGAENTRINITNTSNATAYVHFFFVQGSDCSVADSFLCLTANQTMAFNMSDTDPGVTGYVVAVATDRQGRPIRNNYLIGDEYVKFANAHAANLGAEAINCFSAPLVGTTASTANINFNGNPSIYVVAGPGNDPANPAVACVNPNDNTGAYTTSSSYVNSCGIQVLNTLVPAGQANTIGAYGLVGRVLAVDHLMNQSGDGNSTRLIVNRIGGSLVTGASTIGAIFGILYDAVEAPYSWNSSGGCQLNRLFSNQFPRTAPNLNTVIPPGSYGWTKFWATASSGNGILGAVINFNANANNNSTAYNGGHNLHKLTFTTDSYTIPVFPAGCQ